MEFENVNHADENARPAPIKSKGLGQRRKAFNPIPLTDRQNSVCGHKDADTKANATDLKKKEFGKNKQACAAVTKPIVNHNPSVIVKPVNGTTTIATASTAATEFSIFCDEDFSDDCSQDEPLNLSLTSVGGKGDADDRTDSVCDVLEAVGMHDRALRELNLNSSLLRPNTSLDDVFGTPASMRTAGKSTANMSELDMSIDAENIEPVCKKGRTSRVAGEVECFPEYASEILKYLLDMEKEYSVDPHYMDQQPEVNHKMRMILTDWLVEVMDEYKLEDETLFLAVSFVDRFQLLGTAALFIAAKYEEIYPPDVNEFVFITDDSYDKVQVLKMEMLILKTLQMNVSSPTTHYFLRRLLTMSRPSPSVASLSEYLCYLTLLQGGTLLRFYPSEIAFSALILAAHSLEEEDQLSPEFLSQTVQSMSDSMHEHDPQFTKADLQHQLNECMTALLQLQRGAGTMVQKSIQSRYSLPKYFAVANAVCMDAAPKLE